MKKVILSAVASLVVLATLILSTVLFAQTNAGPSDDENFASLPDFQLMIGGNGGYVTGNSDIKNALKDSAQWFADEYNADAGYPLQGFKVDKASTPSIAYGFELGIRHYGSAGPPNLIVDWLPHDE